MQKKLLVAVALMAAALAFGIWQRAEKSASPVASTATPPVPGEPAGAKPATVPVPAAPTSPAAAATIASGNVPAQPTQVRGPQRPLDQLMFGWDGPVELKDVPPGRLHDQLAKISAVARARALKQIGDDHIPLNDVGSLNVDSGGMLFYACDLIPPIVGNPAVAASEPVVEAAPVPISSPPIRHSKPGATNVIYLDFNGHTITGTAWNGSVTTYVAKPYDKDGDPTTFNDAEQADIIHVWERVAEDYKPFNVDVTTEDPVTFTSTTGRILITPNVDANGVNMPSYTAGGVAYVGVFGASNYATYYSPALVYSNQLGPNVEHYIAEAASHEMGHNMGLSHDGTSTLAYYGGHGSGETSWGPIMGTGYGRNVSQWSKGEYYDANNTQDDLVIISGRTGYQPDDRTDLNATATPVTVAGSSISAAGFIGQTGEADRFSFSTGAGSISITASPYRSSSGTYGGDLDIQLELIDSSNAVVATANPAATTTVTLATTVGGGTYYLRVTGVGVGNPLSSTPDGYTSYASLGAYTITGTVVVAGVGKFSAGRYHSLRLNSSSALYATGLNTYGQLGNGTTSATPNGTPQLITLPGGRTVADIAAGAQHSLFLTTAGELWVTGSNANGQLGIGTTVDKSTPVQAASGVAAIAASVWHSAYLKTDGTLWTVGFNDEGQLGTGSTTEVHTPVQIASDVVELAAGNRQTLFVKSDGTLWGTGDLYNNGTLTSTPIQLATGVQTVAAGAYHSLILKTDGTLWTLGFNNSGQLGNGGTTTSTTPVQIATSVKAIAAGYFFSVFLKTDNTLWACGANGGGQLGDGTTTNRTSPYQLATNVAAVSTSENYTLFSKNDGTFWATGYNANGQFGNGGTVSPVLTPVLISTGSVSASATPSGVTATNEGYYKVNLTWQPLGTANSYEVWRSTTNSFGSATRIAQNVRWAFYQDATGSAFTTYYYWITAVNPAGTSTPSTSVVGNFGIPMTPYININPLPQSVAPGATATFTVAGYGFPDPTFQWQRLPAGSGTWSNVTDTGSYSGSTTTTLTVSNATLGMSGDNFRCLASNIAGTFQSSFAQLTVASLAINDFNGDGKSDIIWQQNTGASRQRFLWLMNGLTFSTGIKFGDIVAQWRIAASADFNADGSCDVVWENTSTGERYAWLMNGTTYAGNGAPLGVVSTDWRIATAGDLNGDGKPDLLWENTVTGERYVWLMNGVTLGSSVFLGTIPTAWHIVGAADFNADGKCDILWENTSTGERYLWLMNGTTYGSGLSFGIIPTDWHIAALGDFNGDGKPDILWENTVTGERYVWLMNGTAYGSGVSFGIIDTSWSIAN